MDHPCAGGTLFWCVFSVLAVMLRGVRWDENYEFAQVLLRIIPYPPDHPLAQYVSHFFSLQTYGLAALMQFCGGALVPNALRNVLFLLATLLPTFLLGAWLTRRPACGYAAALLMLLGVHVPFYSTYPVHVWPSMYSNGHIGQGAVLLTLFLILAGYRRAGYFLAGVVPAIHLGQFPPLALWLALRFLWLRREQREGGEYRAWRWLAAGLFVTVAFGIVQRQFALPPPQAGAYSAAISPEEVFRGYMAHHASHRSIPWGTGHIALIAFILLAAAAARREAREGTACGPVYWLSIYGGLIATLVWGIMAVHLWAGSAIPQELIGWMPYRLINHISPLLIPLVVIIAAGKRSNSTGSWLLFAVPAFGILRPALAAFLPESIYERYAASGEAVYFALYGAAYVRMAWSCRTDRRFLLWWWPVLGIALSVLAYRHQFGAVCVLSGALVAHAMEIADERRPGGLCPISSAGFATAVVLVLAFLLVEETRTREHLPVSDLERHVRACLETKCEPDAMILVRHQQETLQARLQHPVMTDMATITWVPYRPALGPSLYKMYRDLYGINLAPRPDEPVSERPWFEVWPAKSRADWQQNAQEYGFRYVLTPAFMQLDLPCILQDDSGRLYQVPQ